MIKGTREAENKVAAIPACCQHQPLRPCAFARHCCCAQPCHGGRQGDGEVGAHRARGCCQARQEAKVYTSIVACRGRSRYWDAWAGAGASRGQKQQELVWEAGLAPALSCRLGGTSCTELGPVAAAKPRCGRDAATLPAAASARTGDEQNNSCFPDSPGRAEHASG